MKLVLSRALNKTQILVLKEVGKNDSIVVTNLIKRISKEQNIPESTLRWNIKTLRELCLLECGSENQKGIPVKLTDSGTLVSEIISDKGGEKNE